MKKFLKKIYKVIPFKKQIFQVLRLFHIPHRIYQHLHFVGTINVKIDAQKKFKMHHYGYEIENELFWRGLFGGWEKISIKLWVELCKSSTVVLDIGANTGLYALVAKTLNPNAQVYAFEPVKRVYEKLQANIQLNNYDIRAYECAVSDQNGNAVIYDMDTEHIYSVTVNKNIASPNTKVKEVEIRTLMLKNLIEEEKLNYVDLIKIDVETHEPQVLKGMSTYLQLYKPTLLIEVLNEEVAQEINQILKGMDYLYYDIDEIGKPKKVDEIHKSSHFNYLICQKDIAQKLGLL